MRFQSTHVMARANHIELPVFMLARLRLKEVHRPLHGELLCCLTSFLKSCTHTFICVKPEGDTKWRIHNVTSFLSSWQLLQPHNFQQVWNFGLWVHPKNMMNMPSMPSPSNPFLLQSVSFRPGVVRFYRASGSSGMQRSSIKYACRTCLYDVWWFLPSFVIVSKRGEKDLLHEWKQWHWHLLNLNLRSSLLFG